jgi:L-iditol 2-dehydrogenase
VQSDPLEARQAVKGLLPGGVTVIIGAGAMGRMHVDLALSYGPRAIVVADLIDERLALTRELFAGRAKNLGVGLHTINTRTDDLKELVGSLTDYRGADDVIVAVGVAKVIESAQELIGRGAVLNLFGGLKKGEDIIGLNTTTVHYKEVNVTGSSGGSPWDIARTLDLMTSGAINAASHITRIGDLAHAPQFLEMIRAQALDGKAVVYPHRPTPDILTVRRWTADDERAYLGEGGR